jgi:uncharacterized membrane protein (DUF4010 family)
MGNYELIASLAVALGTGFLIGLQREHSASLEEKSTIGGIRTYPLVALAGGIAALVAQAYTHWILIAGLLALMIPISIAYFEELRGSGDRGITSEVTMIVTYLLGALSVSRQVLFEPSQRLLLIAGSAVAVTSLLSLKEPLHKLVSRFSRYDMYTTVKFLVLAVIVLPLLPNETMGPLDVLNPFQIGLMIVLLAGLGLIGYVLVRVLGPGRGMGLAGLVGGLASSTAVTLAMSNKARQEPRMINVCALAVVLASAVMPVRIVIEVAAVDAAMTGYIAAPMGAMLVAGLLIGLLLYRSSSKQTGKSDEQIEHRNPLEMSTAVYFGVLFAGVLLLSKAAVVYLGSRGLYISSAVSGLVDLDAITLSLANMARSDTIAPFSATVAIVIAVAANTAVKAALAIIIGGWRYGWRVAAALAATLAAGGAALMAIRVTS